MIQAGLNQVDILDAVIEKVLADESKASNKSQDKNKGKNILALV